MTRRFWQVLGLLICGLATLAVVGVAVELRTMRAAPCDRDPSLVGVDLVGANAAGAMADGDTRALAALAGGLADSMERAGRALERGDRSTAAQALDAARRVGTIGRFASGGAPAFVAADADVTQARRAMQNGDPAAATTILGASHQRLRTFEGAAIAPSPPGDAYRGAAVLDTRGRRIGELEAVDEDSGATLRVGGWPDFMGVVDIGGRHVRVPTRRIVFGPVGAPGRTAVVLPLGL